MKALFLMAILSGCATYDFVSYYSTDSLNLGKCEPIMGTSPDHGFGKDVSDERIREWEVYTGYSDCRIAKNTQATMVTECKKPHAYRHIISKSMAECNEFLIETKRRD